MILKKDLTNFIVDKAIFLLEEALHSNENAYAFRDYLSIMYNTSTEGAKAGQSDHIQPV